MASNNYVGANVTPSSDTFREWVDLTNRITFDMSDKVLTAAKHSVGGGTTGNAYLTGIFSANTLMISDSIKGVSTDDSANTLGANSALANLSISTNTVFVNSYATVTSNTTVNAFSIAEGQFVYQANSTANQVAISTSVDEFESNATNFNVNGTAANFGSTTTKIDGTTLDIDSTTVDVDGTLLDITSTDVNISGSNVTIDSVNVDIDGTAANLDSTTTNINGTTLDINSATVDIDSATEVNVNAPDIDINGALLDINSTTVDIDGTTTDINADDVNISGANSKINSTHLDIHGTTLDINSNTNIDGVITTTANATIGNANDDVLTVNANTVLTDKLDVAEATNLQKDLTVGGHTTLNGNTVIGDNINVDELKLLALVNTHILPSTNGSVSIGNTTNRWDGTFDDLVGEDITSNNTLTVTGQADFNGDVNLGDAATDTVTFVADVDSNILPSANGNDLGAATARWDLIANGVNVANHAHFNLTANVEGVATFGNDVDIASEANTGTLRVRSTSQLEGFANAVGSIGVGANAHIGGNTYIHHGNTDGLTTISDSNITVGNSTVNTAITTGGVNTDGTLDVLGASVLNSTLGVGGATTLQDTLAVTKGTTLSNTIAVTGNSNFSNSVTIVGPIIASNTLSLANNATITGTLGVTRATTLANTLAVTGTSTLTGDVTAAGNIKAASANVSGHSNVNTLGATGAVDFDSTLNADGATTLGSTLGVTGNITGQQKLNITNSASFSNTVSIDGTTTANAIVAAGNIKGASANVTGGLQANGATDLNGTLDVQGAVAIANTLAAQDTTVTGFVNATTTLESGGNLTVGANADITGNSDVTGSARFRSSANVDGLLRAKSDLNVTGTANASLAIHVGTANTKVRLANNSIAVGNAAANSKLTSTTISTGGTLSVTGTSTLTGDVTTEGNIKAASANVTGHANVQTIGVNGAADFDGAVTVEGLTNLKGSVDLGDATSDTVSFTGKVDTSLQPSANGKLLGGATKRWAAAFSTLNTSSSGTIGGGLAVNGTTNSTSNTTGAITSAGGLGVKKSVTIGEELKVFSDADIDGDLDVGATMTVRSSGSESTVTATTLVANNLTIVNTASLPTDTTFSINEADIVKLNVSANANFGPTTSMHFNLGGSPAGKATVNLTNAHFTNTMVFDDRLQIGAHANGDSSFVSGSNGTQANTTAVESENIYARSDLIGNYSSDQRLKDNKLVIDTALNKVEEISGYEFTWNNNIEDFRAGKTDYGVIAQELEKVLPHAVDINNRGYKTVNYNSLIPLLIEAVKELSGRVKELEKGDEVDG